MIHVAFGLRKLQFCILDVYLCVAIRLRNHTFFLQIVAVRSRCPGIKVRTRVFLSELSEPQIVFLFLVLHVFYFLLKVFVVGLRKAQIAILDVRLCVAVRLRNENRRAVMIDCARRQTVPAMNLRKLLSHDLELLSSVCNALIIAIRLRWVLQPQFRVLRSVW